MNWHLIRNSWQTLLNRTTTVSPLCPNWNQRTLTTFSPSWRTVFTYKTRRWQWRDSGYMVHLGKCSFQQSSPPSSFSSTLRKHGASLSVLNQKNKGEMKPLCCISSRTWILALLWIVRCNADFFRQDQWGQSFGTVDTSLFVWLGLHVCWWDPKIWGKVTVLPFTQIQPLWTFHQP